MFGVALLTSALLALATARIYNRCELANDLLRLGVNKDQLATWVCIAFHESRFDTAARNPHSGDHGLLQISELYWCGPGKACGVSCSAFRDDDISDDVECAQQIYQEHTRLQGDGFLAWVVYPHHCRHNAKKYLADCDSVIKDIPYKLDDRGRALRTRYQQEQKIQGRSNETVPYYRKFPNIDELKPPSITINAILGGKANQKIEEKVEYVPDNDYKKEQPYDWLNNHLFKTHSQINPAFKIDNIDELKPPSFVLRSGFNNNYPQPSTTYAPTMRTTTYDPTLNNIKPPNPRRIESNQFRRRKMMSFKNDLVANVKTSVTSSPPFYNPVSISTTTNELSIKTKFAATVQPHSYRTEHSTLPPTSQLIFQKLNDTTIPSSPVYTTFNKPEQFNNKQNTLKDRNSFLFNSDNFRTSTAKSINTNREEIKNMSTDINPRTSKPLEVIESTSLPRFTVAQRQTNSSVESTKIYPEVTINNTDTYSRFGRKEFETSTTRTPRPTRPWITFSPRSGSTPARSQSEFFTTRTYYPSTKSLQTTTPSSISTQKPSVSTTIKTSSATQSIFDLYLRPTTRPPITFRFSEFKDSPFKLRIFSGGTTTLSPSYLNSRRVRSLNAEKIS